MSRQYSPKTFLRQTPNPVLRRYFRAKGIDPEVVWDALTPRSIDPLYEAIEALPDGQREAVERDFRQVFDLANPRGRLVFVEQGAVLGVDLGERLADVENHYDAAMVVLLEHADVFEVASCVHEMDRLGHWRKRQIGKRLHASTEPDRIEAFEAALRRIYRKQGRGRCCHVDPYQRRDPLRFCYFAYPEDFPTSDVEYDEHRTFQRVTRRPAMENAFVYDPEAGTLDISATGPKEHKEALAEAFCKHILGLAALPPEDGRPRYTLAPAMDPSFQFPVEPEDGVARIEFKSIRLDYPDAEQSRITVSVTPDGTPNAIHASMRRNLNLSASPLSDLHPSQGQIVAEFKPVNGRRGRRVRATVTYPDRCNLGDDPHEQVVRRILQRAGLAND